MNHWLFSFGVLFAIGAGGYFGVSLECTRELHRKAVISQARQGYLRQAMRANLAFAAFLAASALVMLNLA